MTKHTTRNKVTKLQHLKLQISQVSGGGFLSPGCKNFLPKDKTLMSKSRDLNVIPLGSGDKGKAPSCGGGWEDLSNFKKNNDLVKTRKPQMYGVLCGKHNNLIVIDYDTHTGGDRC